MTTEAERRMEDFILSSSISASRTDEFLQDFKKSRRQCASLETVFRGARCFREAPEWNAEFAAGYNVLLRKGPLVEGSNWVPYRTWEFALGLERHLLSRFERLLQERPPLIGEAEIGWPAIMDAIQASMAELSTPSLIVISAPLSVDLMVELYREEYMTPHWKLPPDMRSQWIIAAHRDIPVLNIRETEQPAVYVVDLCRYGELIKHDDIDYEFTEIGEDRANEMLEKRPDLFAGDEPVPKPKEDRLRELRLHVGLRLYESYQVRPMDSSAATRVALRTLHSPGVAGSV